MERSVGEQHVYPCVSLSAVSETLDASILQRALEEQLCSLLLRKAVDMRQRVDSGEGPTESGETRLAALECNAEKVKHSSRRPGGSQKPWR